MRTISFQEAEELYPSKFEGEIEGSASADWKSPDDVLRGVDEQLKKYGLEIVSIDDGGDSYIWVIDEIKE